MVGEHVHKLKHHLVCDVLATVMRTVRKGHLGRLKFRAKQEKFGDAESFDS